MKKNLAGKRKKIHVKSATPKAKLSNEHNSFARLSTEDFEIEHTIPQIPKKNKMRRALSEHPIDDIDTKSTTSMTSSATASVVISPDIIQPTPDLVSTDFEKKSPDLIDRKISLANFQGLPNVTNVEEKKSSLVSAEQETKDLDDNKLKLNSIWRLWSHETQKGGWDLKSYTNILTIDNIPDFFGVFNNIQLLGGINAKDFFLFRDGISPLWEDPENRNGGIGSIQVVLQKSLKLWLDIGSRVVGENLMDDMDDINGISITSRKEQSVIRIWNKNSKKEKQLADIMEKITKEHDKYVNSSIKYKKNNA